MSLPTKKFLAMDLDRELLFDLTSSCWSNTCSVSPI